LGSAALGQDEVFSAQEWVTIKTLSLLPDLPVNTTNQYSDSPTAALAEQKLFFEPRLSSTLISMGNSSRLTKVGQLLRVGVEVIPPSRSRRACGSPVRMVSPS
jgi:hypothetical protein